MAFPVVESITETIPGESSDFLEVSMPATVNAGDLLIMFFANNLSHVITTTPSGWTFLDDGLANGDRDRISVYVKDADGTEGGTTVTVSIAPEDESLCAQVYRVTGWNGTVPDDVELSSFNTGSSANPDPPSLSPAWGVEDTLWIVLTNWHDLARSITAYPASYGTGTSTTEGGDDGGAGIGSAQRELNTASEDPGTFTLSGGTPDWATAVLAVSPVIIPQESKISVQAGLSVMRLPDIAIGY